MIAPPPSNAVTRVVRYGDGGATLERDDDDDALQQHPFFDGLREAPKEAEPGAKKPFNPFLVSH